MAGRNANRQENHRSLEAIRRRLPGMEKLDDRLMMHAGCDFDTAGQDGWHFHEITHDNDYAIVAQSAYVDLSGFNAAHLTKKGDHSIPHLNSYPGATYALFLDFDGFELPEDTRLWKTIVNDEGEIEFRPRSTAPSHPVFSLDDDPAFSATEISTIASVWESVAEDYAPFDINVTTVDPGQEAFDNGTALRAAIGGGTSGSGTSHNSKLRHLDGTRINFKHAYHHKFVSVYADSIRNGVGNTNGDGDTIQLVSFLANTIAHESGHAMGLDHQVIVKPGSQYGQGYSHGDDDGGYSKWTPIMGSNTAADRTKWNTGPTNQFVFDTDDMRWVAVQNESGDFVLEDQNAMSVLAQTLGHRADDHGSTLYSATVINTPGLSVNEIATAGIIESLNDKDWFSFTTSGGTVSLNVNVPEFGVGNLDVAARLYHVPTGYSGTMEEVAIDTYIDDEATSLKSRTDLEASITTELPAGRYVLEVFSHGAHGDVGQYTISGSIPPSPLATPSIDPRLEFWAENRRIEIPIRDPIGPVITPTQVYKTKETARSAVMDTARTHRDYTSHVAAVDRVLADSSHRAKPNGVSNAGSTLLEDHLWETVARETVRLRPSR